MLFMQMINTKSVNKNNGMGNWKGDINEDDEIISKNIYKIGMSVTLNECWCKL